MGRRAVLHLLAAVVAFADLKTLREPDGISTRRSWPRAKSSVSPFDDQFASYASGVLGTGGAGVGATAMGNASRKARALDAAAAKGRRKGPKAGGAAQRTALM